LNEAVQNVLAIWGKHLPSTLRAGRTCDKSCLGNHEWDGEGIRVQEIHEPLRKIQERVMAKNNGSKNSKSAPKAAPAKALTPIPPVAPPAAKAAAPVKTPARNTPVPRPQTGMTREITSEMIAKRAFEIYAGGTGSSEHENWLRAERELRSGL
jgi:hypothetical protein